MSKNVTTLSTGLAALGLLFTIGCSNTPEDQRDRMNDKMENIQEKMDDAANADDREEWVEDKNAVAEDLRELQMDIDKRLGKVEEKLAEKDLKPEKRQEQEAMRTELQKEKKIVAEQLANVDAASSNTWGNVKSGARKAMDDIKTWWDKQEEKMDRETDADNDHDGH